MARGRASSATARIAGHGDVAGWCPVEIRTLPPDHEFRPSFLIHERPGSAKGVEGTWMFESFAFCANHGSCAAYAIGFTHDLYEVHLPDLAVAKPLFIL